MGADRLPAVPFSIFSITAKYGFVKLIRLLVSLPVKGAVFIAFFRQVCYGYIWRCQ